MALFSSTLLIVAVLLGRPAPTVVQADTVHVDSSTVRDTSHSRAPQRPFTLTSAEVHAHKRIASAQVASKFGCTGDNVSPALAWANAPVGTRSFAVTLTDLDAHGFWHWVIYNIPATVTALASGAGDLTQHIAPAGSAQGVNSFGELGYGGPCPPPGGGPHRYRISVFALPVDTLDAPQPAYARQLGAMIHSQALAHADLTASYSR